MKTGMESNTLSGGGEIKNYKRKGEIPDNKTKDFGMCRISQAWFIKLV